MLKISMPPLLRSVETPVGAFIDHAESQTLAWTARHGLAKAEDGIAKLAAMKPAALAAHCYPSADIEKTCTLANWMSWLFILDDLNDEAGLGWCPDDAERMLSSVYEAAFEGGASACRDALAQALSDFWTGVHPNMAPAWRRRFSRHVANYFAACVWQAAHRAVQQTPRLDTFAQMRRDAGAIWPSFDLIEWVAGTVLPSSLYLTSTYQSLLTSAADVVCWTNDLLTLDKEMAHGDTQNMILVMQGARGGSLQDAVDAVVLLADGRVKDFMAAEAELDGVLDLLRFQDGQRAHVAQCVAMLRAWMRGHVEWGTQTRRYRQRESIWAEASP